MLLCIGFWTPIGQERLGGTAYKRFDNLLVRFMDVAPSSAPASGLTSSVPVPTVGHSAPTGTRGRSRKASKLALSMVWM